ncbi:nucleotidyltransferase domain-containing protein [Candidatus Parvarchaeota archaeon]|jgi:predicted nucleotidyltransferase|uniref:Nucleotidyltransferase domain-containing protein n=1 Tax=Candidatus Acidifodinimicrobium mancum TaxID=2898728 RepID=A0A8T3UU34_9ARCH|nr:nucleotidyltransferase domain-containing protein [Candidatus Acidifodinimicrobium mancum]
MSQIKIYSREEVDKPFREVAMERFGYGRGAISKAAEEALIRWTSTISAINSSIEKIVEKAKKDNRILAVILFGSYARKEPSFRDVDVGLLLYKSEESSSVYFDYAALVGGENYLDLSVINSLPVEVQMSAFDDAIVLYSSNEPALHDYTITLIKKSAAVRHLIREALESV